MFVIQIYKTTWWEGDKAYLCRSIKIAPIPVILHKMYSFIMMAVKYPTAIQMNEPVWHSSKFEWVDYHDLPF